MISMASPVYESRGQEFESLRARQLVQTTNITVRVLFAGNHRLQDVFVAMILMALSSTSMASTIERI